jgi:hypothetical protein
VCSELTGSPFVSVKINGLGNFMEESKFYTLTDLEFVNLAGEDNKLVTLAH